MANNVNELYYFYGNKEDILKLHDLFLTDQFDFNGKGYVEILYDIDPSKESFKIEACSAWNSSSSIVENEIKNHKFKIKFYLASYEESVLWCFSDDMNSELIKEDYVISYLPPVDKKKPDNPINELTKKHYYTAEELKQILNKIYSKNESLEYYIDYFKKLNESDDSMDCSWYTDDLNKFFVDINKLSRGKKEENLFHVEADDFMSLFFNSSEDQ